MKSYECNALISRKISKSLSQRRALKYNDTIRNFYYQTRVSAPEIKTSLMSTTRFAMPSGRQSEQQNKGDCGTGVIDTPCHHPLDGIAAAATDTAATTARARCEVVGVHFSFLLILLFPQTGSQALIQWH